jgi:hypothetical protein
MSLSRRRKGIGCRIVRLRLTHIAFAKGSRAGIALTRYARIIGAVEAWAPSWLAAYAGD